MKQDRSDTAFIAGLYQEFHPLMKKVADSILPEAAEDVIHDACIRLLPKAELLQSLETPALVRYLITTVRNTAINALAKQKKYRHLPIDAVYNLLENSSFTGRCEEKEQVNNLLDGLSQIDRDLIFLRFYLDFDTKQIAKETGLDPKSIASRLYKAKARMRKRWKEGERDEK